MKSLKGKQVEVKGDLKHKGKDKTLEAKSIVKTTKGKN